MNDIVDENTQERYWDFKIKGGSLQIVDNEVSEQQRAIVATFLQRGTVPQMPSVGNQWSELLTGDIQPQELNSQVRDTILNLTGGVKFFPKYTSKNGNLYVEVKKV